MDADQAHERMTNEFVRLFDKSATRTEFAESEALLAWLPNGLIQPSAPPAACVNALEEALRAVIERHREGFTEQAQHVRAANELLGWTTRSAEEIRGVVAQSSDYSSKPSSTLDTIDPSSKTVRQLLAGDRYSRPIRSTKRVKQKLPEIASGMTDALEEFAYDRAAVRALAASLRDELEDDTRTTTDLKSDDDDDHQTSPTGQRRTRPLIGALAGVTLIGGIGVWLLFQDGTDAQSGNGQQRSEVPAVRQALVSYTEGHGLSTFLGPANTYPRGNPANLPEGTVIAVVCQERDGQVVHDPTGDPDRYTKPWPVWDKLSNGLWVSDLYTDLPKQPGDEPPEEIPRC